MEEIDQRLLYDQRESVENQRSQLLVDVLPVFVQKTIRAVAQQLVAIVQVLELVVQPADVERQLQIVGGQVLFAVAQQRAARKANGQIRIVYVRI